MEAKVCRTCSIEKPLSDFYRYDNRCNECRLAALRADYQASMSDPDKKEARIAAQRERRRIRKEAREDRK